MISREIVEIDEEKCNGCGLCIPNCAEGALQIMDGKARLVKDIFRNEAEKGKTVFVSTHLADEKGPSISSSTSNTTHLASSSMDEKGPRRQKLRSVPYSRWWTHSSPPVTPEIR